MKSLPNPIKPSALIRLALCDEKKASASSDYTVDMDAWHNPVFSKCCVCFAGAVMAMSLEADPKREKTPKEFGAHTSNCLLALNYFRRGNVYEGLHKMGLSDMRGKGDLPSKLDRDVTRYDDDRDAFRADMDQLADDLEAIDL